MKYKNFLAEETSPYLLQHSLNPVSWYPWGETAFAKAQQEDKPIFLSIGYSTCHWCHVMAHESFENKNIANILNESFIAIKVDREERPDIDNVYMRICQAATGSGGWPMSIFMAPLKEPFYAGTYFPPEVFLQILTSLAGKWQTQRNTLQHTAAQLQNATKKIFGEKSKPLAATTAYNNHHAETASDESLLIKKALNTFRNTFDDRYGGFGSAPKFPTPHNLMFLLGAAPAMAEKTLLHMYKGGIFDHIGGGFCRYSTDERWLVPHFEKMLYDNALLAVAYTMAYEKSGREIYKIVTEKILQYLKNEMLSPYGGFYSAQDADTDGEEGKYYLFIRKELLELLGEINGGKFCDHYDITAAGNYENKSIPNLIAADADAEQLSNILADKLNESIPEVYRYRQLRTKPQVDVKLLTGWNALTVAALAFAGRSFDRDDYLTDAKMTLTFIKKYLQKDGSLLSGITSGKTSGPGFLDDYAFFIFALLQMYKATGDSSYADEALSFTIKTICDFGDEDNGGFFFSGKNNERLITEIKESYDGAIPSGNAVMYYNMSRLMDISEYVVDSGRERVDAALTKHRSFMNRQTMDYPAGHCFYLLSLFPAKKITCSDNVCRPTDDIL